MTRDLEPVIVASYFNDFAHYRADVFGSAASPVTAVDVAEKWISGLAAASPSRLPQTPYQARAVLVRLVAPQSITSILGAIELIALGAAFHDAVGDDRPEAAESDTTLVLLGDLIHARGLLRITAGGRDLRWLVGDVLEPLVVNQLAYSTPGGPDGFAHYEHATWGGGALLAAAAVRCAAFAAGRDEAQTAALEQFARKFSMAVHLEFDSRSPLRAVGGRLELNRRNAAVLSLTSRWSVARNERDAQILAWFTRPIPDSSAAIQQVTVDPAVAAVRRRALHWAHQAVEHLDGIGDLVARRLRLLVADFERAVLESSATAKPRRRAANDPRAQ